MDRSTMNQSFKKEPVQYKSSSLFEGCCVSSESLLWMLIVFFILIIIVIFTGIASVSYLCKYYRSHQRKRFEEEEKRRRREEDRIKDAGFRKQQLELQMALAGTGAAEKSEKPHTKEPTEIKIHYIPIPVYKPVVSEPNIYKQTNSVTEPKDKKYNSFETELTQSDEMSSLPALQMTQESKTEEVPIKESYSSNSITPESPELSEGEQPQKVFSHPDTEKLPEKVVRQRIPVNPNVIQTWVERAASANINFEQPSPNKHIILVPEYSHERYYFSRDQTEETASKSSTVETDSCESSHTDDINFSSECGDIMDDANSQIRKNRRSEKFSLSSSPEDLKSPSIPQVSTPEGKRSPEQKRPTTSEAANKTKAKSVSSPPSTEPTQPSKENPQNITALVNLPPSSPYISDPTLTPGNAREPKLTNKIRLLDNDGSVHEPSQVRMPVSRREEQRHIREHESKQPYNTRSAVPTQLTSHRFKPVNLPFPTERMNQPRIYPNSTQPVGTSLSSSNEMPKLFKARRIHLKPQ